MFCRQYIKKIFSLVSVVNHSNFFFPKIFFMRVLFRFPKFPYTFDFQVLFLESQKSVKGNRASSLSSNRSKSAFCKAFFRKLFFFLITVVVNLLSPPLAIRMRGSRNPPNFFSQGIFYIFSKGVPYEKSSIFNDFRHFQYGGTL